MERRTLVKLLPVVTATALGPQFWRDAYARPAEPGAGPYGVLQRADANGFALPAGFTSRIVARSGEAVPTATGSSTYVWHTFPDGGACFPNAGGGWIYVSNAEVPLVGGVGAMVFRADGTVADAYSLLAGSSVNCAGGPTPWGTWLSCEEVPATGRVWETFPTKGSDGAVVPAVPYTTMGQFAHEAAAVDLAGRAVYLTEDAADGRLYRFLPASFPPDGRADLSAGTLQAAAVATDGRVTWVTVPNGPADRGGYRGADSTPFRGGEGLWIDERIAYVATKGDDKVWALDLDAQTIETIYDAADPRYPDPKVLTGVDNLVVHARSGDLFVAEDGGSMDLVVITPEREIAPFLRLVGQDDSELAGPAFSPDGTHLYLSSQRGGRSRAGITYEIAGPFRRPRTENASPPPPSTTTIGGETATNGSESSGGVAPLGFAAVAAATAAAVGLRARRRGRPTDG